MKIENKNVDVVGQLERKLRNVDVSIISDSEGDYLRVSNVSDAKDTSFGLSIFTAGESNLDFIAEISDDISDIVCDSFKDVNKSEKFIDVFTKLWDYSYKYHDKKTQIVGLLNSICPYISSASGCQLGLYKHKNDGVRMIPLSKTYFD